MKMKNYPKSLLSGVCLLAFSTIAAQAESHEGHDDKAAHADHVVQTPLIAKLIATEGNDVSGTVTFKMTEDKKGVVVTMKVKGLKPNAKHAIHVHEFGDLTSTDGTSAGGHFDPDGHDHGLLDQEMRHTGDLGNLETNAEGVAEQSVTVDNMTLTHGKHAVVGRSVVIHVGEDKGTQPSGDAGDRIAVGVIGVQQSAK